VRGEGGFQGNVKAPIEIPKVREAVPGEAECCAYGASVRSERAAMVVRVGAGGKLI